MELLVSLLIFLIVAAVVYYICREIVAHLPVPAPLGNIIIVVVLLIMLIFFIQRFVTPLL